MRRNRDGPMLGLEKYYLPFLSEKPLLMLLYSKWKKGPLALADSGPNSKSYSPFLINSDAGFMVEWGYLFPDLEPAAKETRTTPKKRLKDEAENKLDELHKRSPEAHYRLHPITQEEYIIYSQAMYFFIKDQLEEWLLGTIDVYFAYYKEKMPKEDILGYCLKASLLHALVDTHPSQRLTPYIKILASDSELNPSHYWGSFWRMDICQRFKEYFHVAIGRPTANLGELDAEEFVKQFEREWQRAKDFLDLSGEFRVVPRFTFVDMVRYATMPTQNTTITYRRIQDLAWEMIDYVVFKICPALFQTLDRLEQNRFRKWQDLLVALTDPLIDKVVERQKNSVAIIGKERIRKGLGPKKERELREAVKDRILNLATREYYYLYGDRQAPREIRSLLDEIEANQKKLQSLSKKEGPQEEKIGYIERDHDLREKLLRKADHSTAADSSWLKPGVGYLPWGDLIGAQSQEETGDKEIYSEKALIHRIKNLQDKYSEAEEKKDWKAATELVDKMANARRKLEKTQSVLRGFRNTRKVRPSYFIYNMIRREYHFWEDRGLFQEKDMTVDDWQDKTEGLEEAIDNQLARESFRQGAPFSQELGLGTSPEVLGQKQFVEQNIVIKDEYGQKKEYVTVGKLADMVGCSPKTLVRMEQRGEIKFKRRRISRGIGRKRFELNRGKPVRLFPIEKVDEITVCFVKDKSIAKIAGVRRDYLPKLKRRLKLNELPLLQQKKILLDWAKKKREKLK